MHLKRLRLAAALALLAGAFVLAFVLPRLFVSNAAPRPAENAPREELDPIWWLGEAPVSGNVVAFDGSPLSEAVVTAYAVRGGRVVRVARARSNEEGRFRLERVPVGFLALVTRAPHLRQDVVLHDVGPAGLSDVEVVLHRGAVVAGRVVHDGEEGVAGLRVCVRSHAVGPLPELEAICGRTGDGGDFSLEGAPRGLVALAVDGEGVTSVLRPDVVAPTEALVVRVVRRGGVEGTVRGPDGVAAEGAEVLIAGSGIWPPRIVRVGPGGAFEALDLPAGVYEIEARASQLVSPRRLGVEVQPGGRVTVGLDLERGADLAGRVVDARTGAPIAGARVSVSTGLLAPAPVGATTGPEGTFVVSGLHPGEHRLSVWAPGHVAVVGRACRAPSEVELALDAEAVVVGRVVDVRGYPIEGAVVEPETVDGAGLSTGTLPPPPAIPASGDGLGVFPGSELREFDPVRALTPAPGNAAAPGVHELDAVALTRIPSLGGAGGLGLRDLAPAESGAPWPRTTGRDGGFRIEGLPEGRIRLVARHPSTAPGRSAPRIVHAGETLEGVEIVLRAGGEILGRVVDERGFPVAGAVVEVRSASAGPERTAITATDGAFVVQGLVGAPSITARREGYAPMTVVVDMSEEGGRQEVELTLIEASRTLRGRVLDGDDFPIAGATVLARALAGEPPIEVRAISGADGTFEAAGLVPGAVTVTASAPGTSPATVLAQDDDQEVTLRLRRAGAATVEVVDADDGDRLDGCAVVVVPALGRPMTARTVEGLAVFESLAAGPARLEASCEGRATASGRLDVAAGAASSDPEAWIRLEVQRALRVVGVVTDAEGEPVIGARIGLDPLPSYYPAAGRGPWATTGVGGRFEVAGVPVDAPSVLHVDDPLHGYAEVEVGPFYPDDEPELEVQLEAPERPRGRRRLGGVAVDLGARAGEIVVSSVARGGEAEAAGIRAGDVIRAVDGVEVSTVHEARRALGGAPGSTVTVRCMRDGEDLVLIVRREALFH